MGGISIAPLSSESFTTPATQALFNQLEELSQRSSISRGQAFEDFLSVSVAALAHPTMENEYLQTVERHKDGDQGMRGCDLMAEMFANLVNAMTESREDILGDLFQGAITYGERGQFLTPEPVCRLMAQMNVPTEDTGLEGRRTVNDPCCGSGRMLLAVAEQQPHWHFIAHDVDLRCVHMTAINLALRNLYGHVVHQNTLTLKSATGLIYETGRVQVYGNAIRKVSRVPLPDREPTRIDKPQVSELVSTPTSHERSQDRSTEPRPDGDQLELF